MFDPNNQEDPSRVPIFFAVTKSFLLGLLPAMLTLVDVLFNLASSTETATPIAAVIAAFMSVLSGFPGLDFLAVTREQVHDTMTSLAPIYAMIVGYNRSHAARPYMINPVGYMK